MALTRPETSGACARVAEVNRPSGERAHNPLVHSGFWTPGEAGCITAVKGPRNTAVLSGGGEAHSARSYALAEARHRYAHRGRHRRPKEDQGLSV